MRTSRFFRRYGLLVVVLAQSWARSLPADTVELTKGTVLRGRVIEVGGNAIELRLAPGSMRRVPLGEIRKATFDLAAEPEPTGLDRVMRKNGTVVQGEAKLSDDGKTVVVLHEDGSQVQIPREEVSRIISRNQVRTEDSGVYTEKVRDEIEEALAALSGQSSAKDLAAAEEKLKSFGIFSIAAVRKARDAAKMGTSAQKALDRIVRLYRLREITPDALQELADFYPVLTQGTVDAKREILEEMFTRYADQSIPVAKFLIRDPGEDPAVRGWAVDLIGRMQYNRDLVDIFNDPAGGQVQLAAAVALARNRILAGAETLIEALEMDEPGTLKDAVGKDFGFGVHDTPHARKDAVAQWKAWWGREKNSIQAQTASLLSGRSATGQTPERKKALEYWKQGCLAWEGKRYAQAEKDLRRAVSADPLFVNAQVSLGVLLFQHRNKADEGRRLLEELLMRRLPDMTDRDTCWIHYHLGEAWETTNDLEKTELAYRRALGIDPKFFRAAAALGDLKFHLATGGEKRSASERRELLREAQNFYRTAIELIDSYNVELETLAVTDLPVDTTPAFERQDHNRTILQVKGSLRRRKAEMHFGIAKARSLLNVPQQAVEALGSAIDTLGDDREGGARELLVELHNYRAFLFEEARETAQALKDYRAVIQDDLDRKNATALEGIRRLRAKGAPQGAEGPARKRRPSIGR